MTRPAHSSDDTALDRVMPYGKRLLPYLWAVATVSVAVVLRFVLSLVLGSALPFITLFPVVFAAAYFGGFVPALVATVISTLAAPWSSAAPARSISSSPMS